MSQRTNETKGWGGVTEFCIVVNGESTATKSRSLAGLIAERDLVGARIATAVNGRFVPEAERAATQLAPGDRVEIVSPRQGG